MGHKNNTARRLAVTGLTVGLLAAGTGGVLAAVDGVRHSGNAAVAQYGTPPVQTVYVPGPPAPPPANTTPTPIVTPPPPAKEETSNPINIHINVPHNAKLKKVTVEVNGKVISVYRGRKASANLHLGNLPCGKGTMTVLVIAVTKSGKTIRQSHKYHHLC